MFRDVECKECKKMFKYEFDINELRGGRKKYCDSCAHMRKLISVRESQREYVNRQSKIESKNKPITKRVVIRDAIKLVLDLNKYSNVTEKSSDIYTKILKILPDKYVTRAALRRHYREVLLKNEI